MKPYILKIILFLNFIHISSPFKGQANSSIHQFTANTISNERVDFKLFEGKKILIVNTASKCGLTPQFEQLQKLYDSHKNKNLMIVGFPSNDFAEQDPGTNKEIEAFCTKNYGVTFLMMEKIHVKGDSIHPIYHWLTSRSSNGLMNSKVKWNFQKYMIDEQGKLVDVVSPWRKANCRKIMNWLNQS